jgi:hypothetical protein
MTEDQWRESSDPYPMLVFLAKQKARGRKLRLFSCGCVRQRVWHLLQDERSRAAVEVAERYAEGEASSPQLRTAWRAAGAAWASPGVGNRYAAGAAAMAAHFQHRHARRAAGLVFSVAYYTPTPTPEALRAAERATHLVLVRCVFGNPFRPARPDRAWLSWNGRTIPRLAQAIYDERALPEGTLDAFRLRVLSDALEEAGCTDADLLGHLRGPGPHVRGCWPVDLLLGRQ